MFLNGKYIFIVEDDVHNRVVYQVLLKQYGAEVIFEKSGRDTLYRLGQLAHVDLIILDLMLSEGYNGLDLFDDIRAVAAYSAVPIIAVSATDPSQGIARTRKKGFTGFIPKPIDKTLFPRQIESILQGEQLWLSR
jgi:CheY-like chemotaxis protein